MNDSTPLLGQVIGHIPPTDSDLFIQAVESPWACISGRALFFIRSSLAITMTSFLTVYLTLEILAGRGKIFIFRLMNLAWIGQCIYMWLTSYWIFLCVISGDQCRLPYAYTCRRYRSYSTNVSLFTVRGICRGCLFRVFTFPSGQNSWNLFLFRTFYTVVMVLPFASTLLYFLLIVPSGRPVILLEVVLNTLNVSTVLAEFFVLNSVTVSISPHNRKRMLIQTLNLAFLTTVYCKIWTRIGNLIAHGPGKELDWRFFGDRWKNCWASFTLVAVNVVCGVYVVWWMLELAKGWIFKLTRRRELLIGAEDGISGGSV